jgi:hypothetical protein
VKSNQIFELIIDDLEFLTDEFFEEEDVSVFVDIVEAIDVSTQRAANLPPVGTLKAVKTVGIGMNVFQLTNIDEVLALHNNGEELEETGNVAFFRRKSEVVSTTGEFDSTLVDEFFEFVILEPIHEQFLVDSKSFII